MKRRGGEEGEVALSLRSVPDGAEQEPDVRETEEEQRREDMERDGNT